MSTEKRSSFTGKLGFVLAAAGSAVGLGNIWRFPYLAAKYGGGIFLLTYVVLALTFGFSLMTAEIAIGRKTGKSAIGAFKTLSKKFGFVGVLASLVPVLILPYYSVIGGWVTKYFYVFASGNMEKATNPDYFGNYIGSTWQPLGWFALFLFATALVVLFGVDKGIEKVSKIMMPVLVVLTLFIAVYSLFLDGAWEGVKHYIIPYYGDQQFTWGGLGQTILGAMGQMFYSMSLAMGIMITYGSYMKKEVNLESSVHQIEWFDTGIAFLAGLMVIPTSYALNGGNVEKGPGLMFSTLPTVFSKMPAGEIIGALFFLLVLFAALTSSISLMETVVSIVRDRFGGSRQLVCILVLVGTFALGVPSAFGFSCWSGFTIFGKDILTFMDDTINQLIMPIVAFLTCFIIGYVIKPQVIIEEVEETGTFKAKGMFTVMIQYIAPVFIVLILVSSLFMTL